MMKNFALKNPFAASLITFSIIFIGGSIAGIVFGILIVAMNTCQPSPNDPCDAGAMAAVAIWTVSFAASFILGVIGGITIFIILLMKNKSLENKSYE